MQKLKEVGKLLESKSIIYRRGDGQNASSMQVGDYLQRFKFILPHDLPSSLYFKDSQTKDAPKAKVKYFVKVRFLCSDEQYNMEYKQILIIREKQNMPKKDCQIDDVAFARTFYFCKRGKSAISCKFKKNIFTPGEVAQGKIYIDNSKCVLPIKTIRLSIDQVLT